MRHTWHPNTFGLLYGKTTKTACSRRVPTADLVKPLETDCPYCEEVILNEMTEQQKLYLEVRELMKEASDAWEAGHPPMDGDNRSPLEMLDAGLLSARDFWALVYSSQAGRE